jgi:hypothetical protein
LLEAELSRLKILKDKNEFHSNTKAANTYNLTLLARNPKNPLSLKCFLKKPKLIVFKLGEESHL